MEDNSNIIHITDEMSIDKSNASLSDDGNEKLLSSYFTSEEEKARFSPIVVISPLKGMQRQSKMDDFVKKKESSDETVLDKRRLRNSTKPFISQGSKREVFSDIEIVSDESAVNSEKDEIGGSSISEIGKSRNKRTKLSCEISPSKENGLKLVMKRSFEEEEETEIKAGKVGKNAMAILSRKAMVILSSDDDDSDFVVNPRETRRRKIDENDGTNPTSEDSSLVGGKRIKGAENPATKRCFYVDSSTLEQNGRNDEDIRKGSNRRNIRKVMDYRELNRATLKAEAAEWDRKKRIEQLQKQYNVVVNEIGITSQVVTQSNSETLILDKDPQTGEALVEVHSELAKNLKPHQVDGVQFMYTSTIESVAKLDQPPGGCILAHCMGLGKTFQVIAFLHTALTNELLHFRTALIIAPVNVILNWKKEFDHWLGCHLHLKIWEFNSVKNVDDRLHMVENWKRSCGVLIIGYDAFRSIVTGKAAKKESITKRFLDALVDPGPDFVVCDEGHVLKNEKTGISQAVNRIMTPRRICLTGTPLQNNLGEYHCMVQFVKPNLLGSKMEFRNRFENPIRNGQCRDSTLEDARVMKQRAHILHSLLDACVHRRSYLALTTVLPPRLEFIIKIRLSKKQIELYRAYLNTVVGDTDIETLRARKSLVGDFQALQRVWTHPRTLYLHQLEMEEKGDDLKTFIDNNSTSSTSSSESEQNWSGIDDKDKADESNLPCPPRTRQNPGKVPETSKIETPLEKRGWWMSLVSEQDHSDIAISGKLVLFFEILKKCEEIGDKLLVFSQSLLTLAVIEEFLAAFNNDYFKPDDDIRTGSWEYGVDYFRMDGSTTARVRKQYIDSFNDSSNLRARLFLISTRAGSLGTNLVGANRVIIFDANWNPSHDVQGTMEERIYDRQVTKQSLALRVVDEHQIERHFSAADLAELYRFDPMDLAAKENMPVLAPPKDLLLRDVMLDKNEWFINYHEHDSLLQHKEEETLTEEEKKEAWNEYKAAREGCKAKASVPVSNQPGGLSSASAQSDSQLFTMLPELVPIVAAHPRIKDLIIGIDGLMQKTDYKSVMFKDVFRQWLLDEPSLIENHEALMTKLTSYVMELKGKLQALKEDRLKAFLNRSTVSSSTSGSSLGDVNIPYSSSRHRFFNDTMAGTKFPPWDGPKK